MNIIPHPDEPIDYLAVGHSRSETLHQIWFADWFIRDGLCIAPGVIWTVKDNVVTRTYKDTYVRPSGLPNPPPMKWVLTDQVADDGCVLGVWPD